MPNKKGSALLMVWVEVPADIEDEFNRWYNEEHIGERLSIPGFLSAARYESDSPGAPKHLAMYEVENIGVMTSDAYLSVRGNPTEWTKRMSPDVVATTYIRNTYEQIFPAEVEEGTAQSGMAPALQIGRMTVPPELDAEWNDWYNSVYVPNYMKVPGCICGRRAPRCCGRAGIPDGVRVRASRCIKDRRVEPPARHRPAQRALAEHDGARRRVAGRVGEDF